MEQDEDADTDFGRRAGGDVGVRADGAGGGQAANGEWRVANWVGIPIRHSLFAIRVSSDDGKLTAWLLGRRWHGGQKPTTIARLIGILIITRTGMLRKFLAAISILVLPSLAQAADITGPAKVRDGDSVLIGNARVRLGGIDAPSSDQ